MGVPDLPGMGAAIAQVHPARNTLLLQRWATLELGHSHLDIQYFFVLRYLPYVLLFLTHSRNLIYISNYSLDPVSPLYGLSSRQVSQARVVKPTCCS